MAVTTTNIILLYNIFHSILIGHHLGGSMA